MKLNPFSFDAHVKHMNLEVYKLSAPAYIVSKMQDLFSEKFKELNKSDNNFCYTCVCNGETTQWRFAYSTFANAIEARGIIQEQFSKIRTGTCLSLSAGSPFGMSNWDGCACPFNSK